MNINKHFTEHEVRTLGIAKRINFTRCTSKYRGSALYVLEFRGGGIKIGIARNLINRLNEYTKPWIKDIVQYQCYSHNTPAMLEAQLKKHFRPYKYENSPEYFSIDFKEVIDFIESDKFYKDYIPNRYK